MSSSQLVYVVDDDVRVRDAICELLESACIPARPFSSATEFLQFDRPDIPSCLLLDVELPDINGLDVQRRLSEQHHPPIIFITGHEDVLASVKAIQAGAIDFLMKPFPQKVLMDTIAKAISADVQSRLERSAIAELEERYAHLTPREREVLPLIISGLLNKQAADVLGISEVTLQIHRGKIMKKMRVRALADLVRMASKLDIPILKDRRGQPTNHR